MSEPTDIEKKSLEAHVELCAQRYKFLEQKLDTVETTLTDVSTEIGTVKSMVQNITNQRNNQIINWGLGIIAVLGSIIGYLITHFVIG